MLGVHHLCLLASACAVQGQQPEPPAVDSHGAVADDQGLDKAAIERQLNANGDVGMFNFTDIDPLGNDISGIATVLLNTTKENSNYYLVWGSDETCNGLEGVDAILSFQQRIPCKGVTCSEIIPEHVAHNHMRVSHPALKLQGRYNDFERAEFTIFGPAVVTLTRLSTEENYDFITFTYTISNEETRHSGGRNLRTRSPSYEVADREILMVSWSSDAARSGIWQSGWEFDVTFSPGARTDYGFQTEAGWFVEVESDLTSKLMELTFTIPSGTAIPPGANRLLVVDNASNCVAVAFEDWVTQPPAEVAKSVSFMDIDLDRRAIAGTMTITRTLPLPSTDRQFTVFTRTSTSDQQALIGPIASITATSNDTILQVEIRMYSATTSELLVYTENATGRALTPYIIEVQDRFLPEGHFVFNDADPGWNRVGGGFTVSVNARAETDYYRYLWGFKIQYALLWGFDDSCSGLAGEAPLLSFNPLPPPDCQGHSCDDISSERIAYNTFRVSNWHPRRYQEWATGVTLSWNYKANEEANYTVYGPASVIFTEFRTDSSTEDWISIIDANSGETTKHRGSYPMWELPKKYLWEGDVAIISWSSDSNWQTTGWIFEVRYEHSPLSPSRTVHVELPTGRVPPAGATKLIIVDTLQDTQFGCIDAPIQDTIAAVEVARAASFVDLDPTKDVSGGTMNITRTLPLPAEEHEFRVFLSHLTLDEAQLPYLAGKWRDTNLSKAEHLASYGYLVIEQTGGDIIVSCERTSACPHLPAHGTIDADGVLNFTSDNEVLPTGGVYDPAKEEIEVPGVKKWVRDVKVPRTHGLVGPIGSVNASSLDEMVQVEIPFGTATYGMSFWLFAANATGQALTPYILEIDDFYMPAGTFKFIDTEPGWNSISGTVAGVLDAFGVASGVEYELLWGFDDSCRGLDDESPLLTFRADAVPSCKGRTCRWITSSYVGDGHYRVSHYAEPGFSGYWSNEEAEFTIHGPAVVQWTAFDVDRFTDDWIEYVFPASENAAHKYNNGDSPASHEIPDGETLLIRWSTDSWGGGLGWIFEVDFGAERRTILNATTIPAGATKLILDSKEGPCLEAPLHDFAPPIEVAGNVYFRDDDGRRYVIGGMMTITRTVPLPSTDLEFKVFMRNSTRDKMIGPITSITATSTDEILQVEIPLGTPASAEFLLYTENATGQAVMPYILEVQDRFLPHGTFMFKDTDPDWNEIGGDLSELIDAVPDSNIPYNVLWGFDDSCSGLAGEAPLLSFGPVQFPDYNTASNRTINLAIPNGTVIPAGATKLIIVDTLLDTNFTCIEAPIQDFVPAEEVAESANFTDMDGRTGYIQGVLSITRRLPLPTEDHEFRAYGGGSDLLWDHIGLIASVKGTSSDMTVQVEIPSGTTFTSGMAFWVYSANATGEAFFPYLLEIEDFEAPTTTEPDTLSTTKPDAPTTTDPNGLTDGDLETSGSSRKFFQLSICLQVIVLVTFKAWL